MVEELLSSGSYTYSRKNSIFCFTYDNPVLIISNQFVWLFNSVQTSSFDDDKTHNILKPLNITVISDTAPPFK
jgi:hypothetical protein